MGSVSALPGSSGSHPIVLAASIILNSSFSLGLAPPDYQEVILLHLQHLLSQYILISLHIAIAMPEILLLTRMHRP